MKDSVSGTDERTSERADVLTSSRSIAVGVITMARYLGRSDPKFSDYLRNAFRHAEASGLTPDDLSFLKLLAKTIG